MAPQTTAPSKTALRPKIFLGATRNLKKQIGLGVLALGLALVAAIAPNYIKASDHDDGEVDTKGRNLNLTDLFVFREEDQAGTGAGNLVFIMNTNPRSLARQQYYFSTRARYEFKVTRVTNNDATPTGLPDVTLRFEFGEPTGNGPYKQQPITVTAIRDGVATTVAAGTTTPLNPNPNAPPTINPVALGGSNVAVFAGLREDPFFFDVEQYFRIRAGLLGLGPVVSSFRPPDQAIDFTRGYNVNAIAVRVPIAYLKGSSSANTFDVWETISVGSGTTFNQVERLARPVINEGLLVTNDLLNTLNRVTPQFEAQALNGQQPAATLAAPIVTEATNTLKSLGNSDAQAQALLGAFLPDVMRIDTTGPSGYGNALNSKGSPIRGRKITDDVVDITLSVLVPGNAPQFETDNVSYQGTPGNPAQGHKPPVNSLPYLAPPN